MKKLVARRVGIGLLSAAVTAGLTGVTTYAMAKESAPTAVGESVRLVVGVKPGADAAAPVRRLSTASAVNTMAADDFGQQTLAAVGARTVEVPARSRDAVIAELRNDPDVSYVEVDEKAQVFDVAPNDPTFVTGEQPELGRLNIPAAWDVSTGSSGVTVAVLDTGVSKVGDLAGAVLGGWDYVNRDGDPSDDHGHGTMVSSAVAARGNNAEGMAGVCWNCKILPVKVMAWDGFGSPADIAKGIIYATDKGAKIINMSLGLTKSSDVLKSAVAYAVNRDVLVVAAAGNYGGTKDEETLVYPAAYTGVLAVGGAGSGDAAHPGSSRGSSFVDVAAPFTVMVMDQYEFYWPRNGTSFSSPLVAGVAALVKSNNPSYNAWSLSSSITRTARRLSGGWVKYGMVDASRAVVEATDRTPPKITGATPGQWSRRHGIITVGATGVADTWSGVSRASLYADGTYIGQDTTSPYAVKLDLSKRKGTVKLQWRVYDKAGNRATFDRSITADNTKPGVTITSAPKDKAKVKGTVKIAVTATDYYGVNRVELLINGKKIQTDKTSPYAFSITASKQPKKMKVQVRAYDNAGNVKYAPTRNWTR